MFRGCVGFNLVVVEVLVARLLQFCFVFLNFVENLFTAVVVVAVTSFNGVSFMIVFINVFVIVTMLHPVLLELLFHRQGWNRSRGPGLQELESPLPAVAVALQCLVKDLVTAAGVRHHELLQGVVEVLTEELLGVGAGLQIVLLPYTSLKLSK